MYYTLPVKERIELMKKYKTAYPGMSYNNMVEHFNTVQEYGDGGKIKIKRKPITTIEEARAYAKQNPEAFANAYVKKSGTIPSTTPTNVKAYNTIEPTSYSDYNNIRRYITNTPRDINKSVMPTADEEAWKQYLGLNNTPKTIIPSTYKPTIAKDKNASYYKINQLDNKLFQSMADYLSDYPDTTFQASEFDFLTTAEAEKNDTSNTTVGNNYSVLGNFTVSKKTDEKGRPYISYYDKYDFNSAPFPIKNTLNNLGKPFEFYDRYYPKDQYESNPKTKTINRIKYGDPKWKIEKEFPDYQYGNGGKVQPYKPKTMDTSR
jgi:hypothetical protein